MQLAQSRVGKTLDSRIILPPIEASRSTTATWKPWSAKSSAACSPAIPPPTTRASNSSFRLGSISLIHPSILKKIS